MTKFKIIFVVSILVLFFQNCGNIVLNQDSNESSSLACLAVDPLRIAHSFNDSNLDFWLESENDLSRSSLKVKWEFKTNVSGVISTETFNDLSEVSLPVQQNICRRITARAFYNSCEDEKILEQEFELDCEPVAVTPPPPPPPPPAVNYCQSIAGAFGMQSGGLKVNRLGNFRLGSEQNYGQPIDGIPYFSVPFTAQSNNFYGDTIWVNLGAVAPDFIEASISPCEGDFRPAASGSTNDNYLKPACRQLLQAENSGLFSRVNDTSLNACNLEQGKSYYLNLKFLASSETSVTGYRGGCNPEWMPCNIVVNITYSARGP